MSKTKVKRKNSKNTNELDGPYLLKIVLYLIIGGIWFKITTTNGSHLPIPVGLLIGILFARNEQFQVDRKIEYAVLLVAMLVGYFASYGLYINL
jgi:hypothetical protein